jgi:hypothetical protein
VLTTLAPNRAEYNPIMAPLVAVPVTFVALKLLVLPAAMFGAWRFCPMGGGHLTETKLMGISAIAMVVLATLGPTEWWRTTS